MEEIPLNSARYQPKSHFQIKNKGKKAKVLVLNKNQILSKILRKEKNS